MVRYAKILVPVLVVIPALFGFFDQETHPVINTLPASMVAGANGTGTVTVNQAGTSDTMVYLVSSNPSGLVVPPMVDVPAGQTQVQFPVKAVGVCSGNVTASANGYNAVSNTVIILNSNN